MRIRLEALKKMNWRKVLAVALVVLFVTVAIGWTSVSISQAKNTFQPNLLPAMASESTNNTVDFGYVNISAFGTFQSYRYYLRMNQLPSANGSYDDPSPNLDLYLINDTLRSPFDSTSVFISHMRTSSPEGMPRLTVLAEPSLLGGI